MTLNEFLEKVKYYSLMSEKEQLEAVEQNKSIILCIKNSSKQVQLKAMKQNGLAIQYIKDPDKDVQFEAIKQDENIIIYIYKYLSKEDLIKIKLLYRNKN